MLDRLGSILGCRPSLVLLPPIARFFSVSCAYNLASTDPEAPKKPWANILLRYRNDAAFREARIAKAKAWNLNHHDEYLQASRASNKHRRQDPICAQNERVRSMKYYHEKYRHDPTVLHRFRLYTWVTTRFDFISTLPWKTHRPLYFQSKVEHFCQGCRMPRHRGVRLWWLKLGSDDQYDCHACYVKDVDASMPQGYEGITRLKDMIALKEQLDRLGQSNKSNS
jgi:hypothetical protein